MERVRYVILVTPDLERMKRFYRDRLGLELRTDHPRWIEFQTAGATLALHPVTPARPRGIEMALEVPDLRARKRELEARGVVFASEVFRIATGDAALFRDPEGGLVTLVGPGGAGPPDDSGPRLSLAIVNCRDLHASKAFWRNVVGLRTLNESGWWVEFDTGDAHLALAPRAELGAADHHHARPMALTLESDDLMTWSDALRARGVEFVAAPHDTAHGMIADVRDPDGNVIVLHERPVMDDDDAGDAELVPAGEPGRGAMRPRLTSRAVAVSRVALRPEYRSRATPERRKPSATTRAVAKARGEGPNGTGLAPRKTGDERKAKTRPAQGRLRKAARTAERAQRGEAARQAGALPAKGTVAKGGRRTANAPRRTVGSTRAGR